MNISPARRVAFDVLRRVEREGAFAADALGARLRREALKRQDAALATELVLGVLRWQRLLDFLAERAAGTRRLEATSLDLEVLLALRLGIYQLEFLERVPASAAVNESVELVKVARKRSAAGLVNALLRNAAREETLLPAAHARVEALLDPRLAPAERLGIALSHPTWLVERWLGRFGEADTRALLEANNRPPRITAAILTSGGSASEANRPGRWLRGAAELTGGNPAENEILQQGRGFVQDEASQMIPLLLETRPGQRVLDLCAAPGGKTARLAEHAGGQCVVAADRHLHRLRQMREFLGHVRAGNVPVVALDGTAPLPFGVAFDRILVDAPCSGTGTLARNPEIRWRLRPQDLPALAEKQAALLRQALEKLAPGGRLVYSTCSLEPEENEQVVKAVLAQTHGIRLVAPGTALAALAAHLRPGVNARALFDAAGYFHTRPWQDGTDGFFAAVMGRVEPETE
jgi:16S rRNA (cytosine967-C5)-methyltransferase